MKKEFVEYRHDDAVLEGYMVHDDQMKGKRPGVIVVHDWYGLNDYAKGRTEQLAGLGYITFAIDMYGKGVRAKSVEEAAELAGIYRSDRRLMRAGATAGLEALRRQSLTDARRMPRSGTVSEAALRLSWRGAALKRAEWSVFTGTSTLQIPAMPRISRQRFWCSMARTTLW
jgi:hypothetical protein